MPEENFRDSRCRRTDGQALLLLLALGASLVVRQAVAEPIVLECDLPGMETPGVHYGWGFAWHGLLAIDDSWTIDDYAFQKSLGGSTITISRSSGKITQEQAGHSRSGTCRLALKENRRF